MKPSPAAPILFLLLLAFVVTLPRAGGGAAQLPIEEPFESFMDGLPSGWTQSAQGELVMSLERETRTPKEGKACWRIGVPVWYSGAAVLTRTGVSLRRGAAYAVEVWLRARDLNVPVTLSLERRSGASRVYLERRCAATAAWRRFVLQGAAPADDPDAVFRIRLPGSGTLYVDALRIAEGEPAPEPERGRIAPVKGNRIHNSSFEGGADGWAPGDRLAVVEGAAPDGERFARWPAETEPLEAQPFVARSGQQYTASAFLRAPRAGARVEMALVELGGGPRSAMTFDVGTDWQRCSFGAVLPCEGCVRYLVQIHSLDPAQGFEVDGIQVEEGELTDYRPAAAVEVGCALPRGDRFPRPDTVISVPVQVYAPGKTGKDLSVHYRLDGFYGEGLTVGSVAVAPGLTHARVPLGVRVPQVGALRLNVEAYSGRDPLSRSELMLAALPTPGPGDASRSFVGVGGSPGSPGEWRAAAAAARAGIRWWRLEGPAGNRLLGAGAEIDALRKREINVLGVLAPADSPAASFQAPARYRGRIAAYEVAGVPSMWTAQQATRTVARIAAAARAVRGADPRALLIAGGLPDDQVSLSPVLLRDLSGGVDAVSMGQATRAEDVAFLAGGRDRVTLAVQALRSRLGAGPDAKPLWNTEAGTPSPGSYTWLGAEEQARAAAWTAAKTLILNRANGVRRCFFGSMGPEGGAGRSFDDLYAGTTALLDYGGAPKPVFSAVAIGAQQLDGVEPAGRVETDKVKAYVFQRGGDTLIAAWSPAALPGPVDLSLKLDPLRVRAVNVMGNGSGVVRGKGTAAVSLRNEPVYLEIRQTAPAVVLRALRSALKAS